MPLLPLATGSRKGKAFSVDTELLVNWYPEVSQNRRARSIVSLIMRPGMALLGNYGESPARGWHVMNSNFYGVFLGELKRITTAGVGTVEGALDTTEGNVSMVNNGDQLFIVDGTSGYIYTESTDTFAKITDGDFPPLPQHAAYQDGFFLVNEGLTERWYKSALSDGTSWDALEFASAQKDPDRLRTLIGDHGEIWLFGDKTVEIWQNTGAADFPFQRLEGAQIQRGIHAPWSLARYNDGLAAIMVNPAGGVQVTHFRNYTPLRISDDAMETRIRGYATSIDAIGSTFATPGHEFYMLAFPSVDESWAYDFASEQWSELRSGQASRWLAQHQAVLSDTQYVTDHATGNVYSLSDTLYDDNGATIYTIARGYHLSENDEDLIHHALELYFERGTALATGQGSDPQAQLRWSNDGGRTWSNWAKRAVGKIGEYRARAEWKNLGIARDRVYELRMSDPIPRILAGARFDVS
jgi:hypothetical protein